MYHVLIVVRSFGSLIVLFAPLAHLLLPPWKTVGGAVVVDQALHRSDMLFLCRVFLMSFQSV